MTAEIITTTVDVPKALMKKTKVLLAKKYGNPHGKWRPLIVQLLERWVEENRDV